MVQNDVVAFKTVLMNHWPASSAVACDNVVDDIDVVIQKFESGRQESSLTPQEVVLMQKRMVDPAFASLRIAIDETPLASASMTYHASRLLGGRKTTSGTGNASQQ